MRYYTEHTSQNFEQYYWCIKYAFVYEIKISFSFTKYSFCICVFSVIMHFTQLIKPQYRIQEKLWNKLYVYEMLVHWNAVRQYASSADS